MNSRVPHLFSFTLLSAALLGTAHTCFADGCGDANRPSNYRLAPGDASDSTHFTAQRHFTTTGSLEVNVGSGELRVERSPEPDVLHVSIRSPGADKALAAYVQDLEVSGEKAVVSVCVPSRYHGVITVLVPEGMRGKSELNVGAGTLSLQAGTLHGDREVNVGAGKLVLYLDGDREYSSLELNIGMGRLKDDRPGGSSAYTVVTRSLSGRGSGRIESNVGTGEMDLEPAGN